MIVSKETQNLIQNTIENAINKLVNKEESSPLITDIYISVSANTGVISLFDDNDEVLSTCTTNDLAQQVKNRDKYYNSLDSFFSPILNKMKSDDKFEKLPILKPFSFVLVDENKDTYTELLLIDDETLIINDELLKGLDEELDLFLKELLNN